MKIRLIVFLMAFSSAEGGASVSLEAAFQAAKLNMESIKRAQSTVEQSKELKNQARSALLPTLSGVGSLTQIDRPDGAGTSPFLLTRQHSAAIRLSQPLLRGGSLSAYDFAKDNILLSQFQKDATELNLYQLIINSYYSLSNAQVDSKNVQEFLKSSKERVEEIKTRTKIGRSRKGELVEAEAQYYAAESQYEQTLLDLQAAEETFEFYTRLTPQSIGTLPEPAPLKGSLSEYLLKVRSRPDVQAAKQESKLAEKQVSIAKGGHYPSLDLTGNYYIDRTGVLETSEWDVGLAVVIPLYQGGSVDSQVKQAVHGKRIAELRSSELSRSVERDVTINYQNIIHLQKQLQVLKKALTKAEEAYRLNKKDYTFGLVTNLDVLQSLSNYIETKRSYNNVIAATHLNLKNLEASTGVIP